MSPRLFVDIETLPCADPADAPPVTAPANYKDPEKIAAYVAEHAANAHRATALDHYSGRILCIGAAVDDAEPTVFCGDDMFDGLLGLIEDLRYPVWVGHNIAGFDIRWLYLHARRARHDVACHMPWDKWSKGIVDTMDLAMGPNPKGTPPRLATLAKFFGVASKTEGIDGSKVYDFWLAGRHQEIYDYCAQDVRVVRDVYRALIGEWSPRGPF